LVVVNTVELRICGMRVLMYVSPEDIELSCMLWLLSGLIQIRFAPPPLSSVKRFVGVLVENEWMWEHLFELLTMSFMKSRLAWYAVPKDWSQPPEEPS